MNSHFSTDTSSDAARSTSSLIPVRPYSGPRENTAPAAVATRAEPYRPAAARVAAAERVVSADELPWIDQFLSTTPVQTIAVVAAEPTPSAARAVSMRETMIVEDVLVAPVEAAPVAAPTSEEWPLDEASARLAEMLPALQRVDNDAPARLFAVSDAGETLPAWSDDDMIDIMPLGTVAQQTTAQQTTAQQTSTPPSVVRSEPMRNANAPGEAAARSLELVAQRVRSGELTLPGYDPALGDSAALIAALAALHGVR